MPLVRITLLKGRSVDELRAIADAVHEALVETFDVPAADRFQIIEQLEHHELIYDPSYIGIERTDQLVFINIVALNTRSVATKQALYAAVAERLEKSAGFRREDVQIILTPNERADWSFGNGVASYVPAPEPHQTSEQKRPS